MHAMEKLIIVIYLLDHICINKKKSIHIYSRQNVGFSRLPCGWVAYYFANLAVQMLKCGLMAALQPLQHKTIVIEL